MYISQQLKNENIAEYLLYMWQVEDLIRANELDAEQMHRNIVAQYQSLTPEQEAELTQWYANLIDMMRGEGVAQSGHLQINRNIIIKLTDLHNKLLGSPKYPFYHSAYYKALPFIVELRTKNGKTDEPELETCFEALYGVMLLRLKGETITPQTAKAIEALTALLSMLAAYHRDGVEQEIDSSGEIKN